jgi:alkanesulfonate monooxygenase SsuD/methylene tetrahydromethanopterin reductase-like flavin-dependent oxidoreductase (luciferase family)
MTLAVSFAPADPQTIVAAIVAAEAAGIDLAIIDYGTPRTPVDPLAVAAAAAMATDRIRLAVAVSPAIVEPFTFARGLAALDHLSGGRAAWRVIAAAGPFRASVGAEQQQEFAAVVGALCESWSADALIDDKAEAAFWRAGATAPIAHVGAHYQVTGPLNTARPPQGIPPRLAWSGDAVSGAAIVIVKPGEIAFESAQALIDVTNVQDAATGDTNGFHIRIEPADLGAPTAFANRFAKALA